MNTGRLKSKILKIQLQQNIKLLHRIYRETIVTEIRGEVVRSFLAIHEYDSFNFSNSPEHISQNPSSSILRDSVEHLVHDE